MKKNRIAFIILAGIALTLSSCVKERLGTDPGSFEDEEVAFRIGSVATKAVSEASSEILDISTVELSEEERVFFRDEVTSLDDVRPTTKGTPAFTQNVAALYGSFRAVALNPSDGSSVFQLDPNKAGVVFDKPTDENAYWHFNYKENWRTKLPTFFFMWMPEDIAGEDGPVRLDPSTPFTVSGEKAGSIKFSYTSPDEATEQQDILFTSNLRTQESQQGEQITFYHALTGVKFANHFNYEVNEGAFGNAETIIKSITISGLKNSGTCVVTPSAGAGTGKSAAAVVWPEEQLSGDATFSVNIAHDFAEYNKTLFPEGTLNPNASKQNLNEDDGSLTFWFIPQELSEDVTLTVVFDVTLKKNGVAEETTFTDKTLTVNLHDALAEGHREWKAGELHTFTLWPKAVGVAIDDKMNDAKTEKSDVVIKNKGNTWQYVRVNLVGNWVGKYVKSSSELSDWTILMGFTSQTGMAETDPWNDKDGKTTYGTFVNLVPLSYTSEPRVVNNWVRFDKYYYYTKAIGPNDAITQPIFDKYTLTTIPEFWIADVTGARRLAQDVHLEMDLMVEAIEAPVDAEGKLTYPDGTLIPADATDGYMKVWANALGFTQVSALDDLK